MRHATGAGARTPEGLVDSIRQLTWRGRLIIMLVIVGGLIFLMDTLTLAARHAVASGDSGWWGAREISSQEDPGTVVTSLRLASLRLFITINGDELAAHYRLTGPSGGTLIQQALAAQHAESGDLLVDDLLGQISVAQFHYGLRGDNHAWLRLQFGPPLLQVKGNMATVTISSTPLRLSLDQQLLSVMKPSGKVLVSVESVQVRDESSAMQVLDISGARRVFVQPDTEMLRRSSSAVTDALLREPGQAWTTGLRAMGGRTVPLLGGLMLRLGSIFAYIVLLWSLARSGQALPGNHVVAVGRNVVAVIVGGFIALAVLGLSYQMIFDLVRDPAQKAAALAGPTGLLTGGALVLWPVACWRVKPHDAAAPHGIRSGAARHPWLRLFALTPVAIAYLIALYLWLGISPFTSWEVLPSVAGIVVLVYLLTDVLLSRRDRSGPTPFPALAAMLATALATTVIWPVLIYSGFDFGFGANPDLHVNVLGKWTYLVAAGITVLGLCTLTFRFIGAACDSHIRYLNQEQVTAGPGAKAAPSTRKAQRLWRAGGLVIAAVALVAILPPLAVQAQVGDPHAPGLVPASLTFFSGLYRALPELLNWLLLGLAITVLLSISRTPEDTDEAAGRAAAVRSIAIPVMMLLLYTVYSNSTWLYIPVTLIVGLMILVWLLDRKSVV